MGIGPNGYKLDTIYIDQMEIRPNENQTKWILNQTGISWIGLLYRPNGNLPNGYWTNMTKQVYKHDKLDTETK